MYYKNMSQRMRTSAPPLILSRPHTFRYVPEYNSLIAFTIPRYHEVCAVASPNRPRYSIFGWFLREGKIYDLYKGEEANHSGGSRSKKEASSVESRGGGGEGRASLHDARCVGHEMCC